MSAAAEVDVSNSVARLDELHDRSICDLSAMSQVEVVEILSELADSMYRQIRQVFAFCEDQVSQSRGYVNDSLNSSISQACTACQIEYSQMFVRLVWREGKEGSIGDELAVGKSQLPQRLAIGKESMDWFIANQLALV